MALVVINNYIDLTEVKELLKNITHQLKIIQMTQAEAAAVLGSTNSQVTDIVVPGIQALQANQGGSDQISADLEASVNNVKTAVQGVVDLLNPPTT